MFNINLIREQKKEIIEKAKHKYIDVNLIERAYSLDIENRNLLVEIEQLNNEKNNLSAQISVLISDKNANNAELINNIKTQVSNIKNRLEDLKTSQDNINNDLQNILLSIPNLCDDSVPIGKDESENKVVEIIGEIPKFDFEPKPHWELAESLKLIDFNKSSNIFGSRFIIYTGMGAKLYRALIQYTLDNNINSGFKEILPPVLLQEKNLYACGQLPKFKDDLFTVEDSRYLSPTAEVQLLNMHANEILNIDDFPIRYTANTSCFRSEAGSAGRDTRGVIRQHQFMKSELFSFVKPEDSWIELDKLIATASNILINLKLPFRKLLLCTGDTGFSSAKTFDLEVYLPSYSDYKEISSCSNCLDFQSRRAKIRYKIDNKTIFPHTLNGSSLAIDRLWAAVVENYQQADGSIKVPDQLVKYVGVEVIK